MRPSVPDVRISDSQDAEMASYRPLSGCALAGLILGLASPLALLDPTFWALPIFGLFFCWQAFRRIKKNSSLAGRPLATTGLLFSLLFLVAAPTDWFVYRKAVRDEARVFSAAWFKYLAENEPQKAQQLALPPAERQPLNNQLWRYHREHPPAKEALHNYVQQPLVRTLLALGPRAETRFYQTASQTRSNTIDQIDQIYAVTYEDDGEKKSFFVHVQMVRAPAANGKAQWRILQTKGGVRPEGW
ncbi:MAG: hypothetical protein ABFC54_06580 [Thermoguttaceae bacterium]